MSDVISLTKALIACPSISPNDSGCMEILADVFCDLPVSVRFIDINETRNMLITHGSGAPHIVFLGHSDVVPTGDLTSWTYDPFTPTEKDGLLYGRGACDMKSGDAAMAIAMRDLIRHHPDHKGSLSLLITSDEEADAKDGIEAVLPILAQDGIHFDYAIIGEPSATETIGDVARVGRRGNLHLHLCIHGVQGHIAYPHLTRNPIHGLAQAIVALTTHRWDEGNADFPPTSCQVSNINGGTGAGNVVPETASCWLNWRFCTESSAQSIEEHARKIVDTICQSLNLTADYRFELVGKPFLTTDPLFKQAIANTIEKHTGRKVQFDTGGGTSDGRFLAEYGTACIELGVCSASAHKIDECVKISDLAQLPAIYCDCVLNLWEKL